MAFADENPAKQEKNNFKTEAEVENIVEEITEENPIVFADENLAKQEENNFKTEAEVENILEEVKEDNPLPFAADNLTETGTINLEPETEIIVETEAESPKLEAEVNNPIDTEARSPQPEAEIENIVEPETPKPEALFPQIETYDHHDSVLIKEIEEEAISAINNYSFTTPESPKPEAHSPKQEETESPKLEAQNLKQEEAQTPQQQAEPIALYNDEKLPFTFLWWLNKTRKEHYENNQPYSNIQPIAQNLKPEAGSQLLNHQIAENILHLGALDKYKDDKQTIVPITKQDKIIKKFITEEPQIKPLPANKIDTENKAKASSADAGELVSETLAKIYVEQMLFAKALETYKKLSLKYPEKSTYFASQIKYLELKVN